MILYGEPRWTKDKKTLTDVVSKDSNTPATYNVVETWYDGSFMDDDKLDEDLIYVKYQGKYLVKNFEYGQVLQKDTMEAMRNLSSKDLLLLKMGVYKHIQLNGYYEKDDTPSPINYILSETTSDDDGGSIIYIEDIKVEHAIVGSLDLSYYGVGNQDSLKLNNALTKKSLILSKDTSLSARVDVRSKKVYSENKSKIKLEGKPIIALYNNLNNESTISGLKVDAGNGGQLNAGVIAIASSKDFLIEDVIIENGGTIGASSPSGVNGISVATSSYPIGEKSTGNINRVVSRNFTKAPINWTTYAEEGVLTNSKFYNSVGNGYCPAIQINGGIKFKSAFNHIDGTEGAGTTIATVGNIPPIASREILSFGNSYYNIGKLGQDNSEEFAIHISDAVNTKMLKDVTVSHEYANDVKQGFLRIAGGASNINVINNFVRNSSRPFTIVTSNNIRMVGNIVEEFNRNSEPICGAYVINGCKDVHIEGGKISSEKAGCYLLQSNLEGNENISVNGVSLGSDIGIIPNNQLKNFSKTKIKLNRRITTSSLTNQNIFIGELLESKAVNINVKCSVVGSPTVYASQSLSVMAIGTQTTPVVIKNSLDYDTKSGIVTGIFADTTGSNIRIRFLNSSNLDLTLDLDIDIYIH